MSFKGAMSWIPIKGTVSRISFKGAVPRISIEGAVSRISLKGAVTWISFKGAVSWMSCLYCMSKIAHPACSSGSQNSDMGPSPPDHITGRSGLVFPPVTHMKRSEDIITQINAVT